MSADSVRTFPSFGLSALTILVLPPQQGLNAAGNAIK